MVSSVSAFSTEDSGPSKSVPERWRVALDKVGDIGLALKACKHLLDHNLLKKTEAKDFHHDDHDVNGLQI